MPIPTLKKPAATVATVASGQAAGDGAASSGAAAAIAYGGGPVAALPLIYAHFWGPAWKKNEVWKERARRLASFLGEICQSPWMNVLSQYGVGHGAFAQSVFFTNPIWYERTGANLLKSPDLSKMVQYLIDRGAASDENRPAAAAQALTLIFLDDSLGLARPAGESTTTVRGAFTTMRGHPSFYAAIASPVDDGADAWEAATTIEASGALASMCADLAPGSGWTTAEGAGVGDDSAGGSESMSTAAGAWSVRRIRSLADDLGSGGKTAFSASAQQPLPLNPGGPEHRRGANAPRGEEQPLLPLPSFYLDRRTHNIGFDEVDLDHFLTRIAHPLRSLDELHGVSLVLKTAAQTVDARVLARQDKPAPAAPAPLNFRVFNANQTFAERFAAMRATLGEGHPDIPVVEAILNGVSEDAVAVLRRRHIEDVGANKFLDLVYWVNDKLKLARTLGVAGGRPLSVWDIGCGGGHFLRVCEYYGHQAIGTDMEHQIYHDCAEVLGVDRRVAPLWPDTPSANLGRKFDMITAMAIEFHRLWPRVGPPRYMTIDQWKFLFNDLMANQLNFPGRIYFDLNREHRNEEAVYNIELLEMCAANGAKVSIENGLIDWTIEAPIRL